jgi:hypothetical protein
MHHIGSTHSPTHSTTTPLHSTYSYPPPTPPTTLNHSTHPTHPLTHFTHFTHSLKSLNITRGGPTGAHPSRGTGTAATTALTATWLAISPRAFVLQAFTWVSTSACTSGTTPSINKTWPTTLPRHDTSTRSTGHKPRRFARVTHQISSGLTETLVIPRGGDLQSFSHGCMLLSPPFGNHVVCCEQCVRPMHPHPVCKLRRAL